MFLFHSFLLITLTHCSLTKSNNITTNTPMFHVSSSPELIKWKFKDYILKFKPTRVWELISQNQTRRGIHLEEFERIYHGIDETDELLSLYVPNGNPKMPHKSDGRRWHPPGDITNVESDRFSLKRRFIELMKQAIYQARNRMIIMQLYRTTYQTSSLYKMGFLMSKTDQAVKTFARYSYQAFQECIVTRTKWTRYEVIEVFESYERLLNLWFDIELLIDLLIINDQNCKRMLNQVMSNKKEAWKFYN